MMDHHYNPSMQEEVKLIYEHSGGYLILVFIRSMVSEIQSAFPNSFE